MSMVNQIDRKLTDALMPESLEITDESHLHAGHAEARPEGETHFRIRVVSDAFNGLSRVMRHRLVNKALHEELSSGIHALALSTLTPDEVDTRGE